MTDRDIFPASDGDERIDLMARDYERVTSWETGLPVVDAGDLGEVRKPKLLPVIDIASWEGDPPPRRSLWGTWLPLHQTTMLTGPGGVGKSLFEQMLFTAIALGKPLLGMETEQRNTLYVTCEDDADELWRRQYDINAALGITKADLLGKLFLCSLTGDADTALAVEAEGGTLETTDRWQSLQETCREFEVGLYAFDNATDALAADHHEDRNGER